MTSVAERGVVVHGVGGVTARLGSSVGGSIMEAHSPPVQRVM